MAASSPEPAPVRLSDEQAYLVLERLRWGGRPATCPHCSVAGRCYLLAPADGIARRTRTGAPTARRLWKCGACRRQFSVLTATVLQGTRVPLPAWITAVQLLAGAEAASVSPADVHRHTGLGPEAARHVVARWRAAAQVEPLRSLVGGDAQLFQG